MHAVLQSQALSLAASIPSILAYTSIYHDFTHIVCLLLAARPPVQPTCVLPQGGEP